MNQRGLTFVMESRKRVTIKKEIIGIHFVSATVFQGSLREKSEKITFTSSTNQLSRALPVPRH